MVKIVAWTILIIEIISSISKIVLMLIQDKILIRILTFIGLICSIMTIYLAYYILFIK